MITGAMKVTDGEIELNVGRRAVTLEVANICDRPFVFAHIKTGHGLDTIIRFIETEGLLVQ